MCGGVGLLVLLSYNGRVAGPASSHSILSSNPCPLPAHPPSQFPPSRQPSHLLRPRGRGLDARARNWAVASLWDLPTPTERSHDVSGLGRDQRDRRSNSLILDGKTEKQVARRDPRITQY